MYNGIGLQTARGSGTNGYVQTNKFFIRSRTNKVVMDSSKGFESGQGTAGVTRKPNKDILEHDRKRKIQLKLLVLEEKLIDQGYTDAEIAEKLDEARKSLEEKDNVGDESKSAVFPEKVSETQTHQIAALKEKQMETLKAALGIESEGDREKKNHDAMATSIAETDDEDEPIYAQKNAADFRKHRVKNERDEKGGMGKIVKTNTSSKDEPKFRSKDINRGVLNDSSDSDSDENRERNVKSKPKKDNRRPITDDDSKIGVRKKREETSRTQKKVVKHKTDSSGSESLSGESSDSGSESDHVKNDGKARKRYDSDDDNSSDSSLKRSKLRHPPKSRRRDDYNSAEDCGYKTKKSSRRHNSYDDDSSDEGNHHGQNRTRPRYRRHHDSDGSSDEDPKNSTRRLHGTSRSKRHDSDNEFYDDRSKKDDRREKHSKKADDTIKKLEQLYKLKEDESGDERGRWNGQPDGKSKNLYPTKDKGSGGSEIDADDHGDAQHSRKESRHDNKREEHYREYHGRSRREWGDEEDLRGRKYDRDGSKDSNKNMKKK
ncbi:protein starmaker [Dorcoceras hygrometricum]|uniref:Protein starmaker n=1 Tax=Dorcoceras hygrometricum TaxID=472368 RepID=A0A2Z7ADJ3_9LAMI|nr:protein starmaker [Dorcoceras hygrometricum]